MEAMLFKRKGLLSGSQVVCIQKAQHFRLLYYPNLFPLLKHCSSNQIAEGTEECNQDIWSNGMALNGSAKDATGDLGHHTLTAEDSKLARA